MQISRYSNDAILRNGTLKGTSRAMRRIRSMMEAGQIDYSIITTKEGQRLDSIAGATYGDGRLWWIIAAASGIGWVWQVPPGTRLKIPKDLSLVKSLL